VSLAPAHEWPTPRRYGAGAAAGAAWALLWFGLHDAGAAPGVFWWVSLVLFAPVLAFLGRNWIDLAVIMALAFATSALVAVALGPGFAAAPADVSAFLERAVAAWLPTLLAVLLLGGVRRALAAYRARKTAA
jgi:hypothetical protein